MLAAKIVLDAAAAQVWPGERVSDRAFAGNHADVPRSVDEDPIPRQQFVDLIQLRNETIEELFELRDESGGQIANLAADAGVGRGESGAGQELEKIIEFFALGEGVEKDRHGAEIQRHRAEPQEMRRDARRFAADHPNRFAAGRQFPTHQLLNREGVGDVVCERRQVIEPVRVRNELVVLHVLGDFFIAAMQVTDIRSRLGDRLAIQFEHEAQNTMRRRMRRSHVEDHFFADVAEAFAGFGVRRGDARDGIG